MKKTIEKFDSEGRAYRATFGIEEHELAPFTPTKELQALLDGEQQCALCGNHMAYLLPIDGKGELCALVSMHIYQTSGTGLEISAISCLRSSSRGLTTVGFYNSATKDLFVTNAPRGSDLFEKEDAQFQSYDRKRLEDAREKIADSLLDRIIEHRDELKAWHLDNIRPKDLEDAREYSFVRLWDMMFEQRVSDAADLDLPFELNVDADMSNDRLLEGNVFVSLIRNDIDQAVESIWTTTTPPAAQQIVRLDLDRECLQERASELTERCGWRIDLLNAIEEVGAKTVTLQVEGCEALSEVKVSADDLLWKMRWRNGYDFSEELRSKGFSYAEISAMPTPEIMSATYRGKEIWAKESSSNAQEAERAPMKAPSLKEEAAQARAASAQLAADAPARTASRGAR